ncbi:uncharacterized protein [Amphiura filiformis]|uniref:uncharacterized protein n=1 Tax=Amphiura filiformis TaxID=82378 RepID=UPI003B221527
MYGLKILYFVILIQLVARVLPFETKHRLVRQSGGQPVVTNQTPGQGQPPKRNNPPGSQPPNSDKGGLRGTPDPGNQIDTRGMEFIFCFTSNVNNAQPQGLQLLIGAGGPSVTNVRVDIPDLKFVRQVEIPQGGTEIVDIPPIAAASGTGPQNGTIWVRATRPVSVHGMNIQVKSHDGFLAIPVAGLGLEYMAASYAANGMDRSQMIITGTQDLTRVKLVPIQRLQYNGKWFNIGDAILFTINRMESVQIQTEGDLTGTRILADRAISVMSGATCSLVPQQLNRCDHLVEHVPPVATWGKKFSVLPLLNRTSGTVLRVLAARPNTRFYTLGQVFVLQRGGLFREFNQPIAFPMSIVSDRPVMVLQYAKGGAKDRTGDPFMTIIPPIEQYVAGGVTFSSFDQSGQDTFGSFATISVTSWDLFNMYLNNEALISHKYKTEQKQDWMRLMSFNADYQMPLGKGANTIVSPAPGSRFTAIAYGFTLGTSYAFPVVYGLRRTLCTEDNTADQDKKEVDCTGPVVSGIVLATNHGTGIGIQPPKRPPSQSNEPSQGDTPGWGNINPSKGTDGEQKGGGDAGVFFPWYTIPPWMAEQFEDDELEEEFVCYATGLLVLALIAPATVIFFVMIIIICGMMFRVPAPTKF